MGDSQGLRMLAEHIAKVKLAAEGKVQVSILVVWRS